MTDLIPVGCSAVVPKVESCNPATGQFFNGSGLHFHAYYTRLPDLWGCAQGWIDDVHSCDVPSNILSKETING